MHLNARRRTAETFAAEGCLTIQMQRQGRVALKLEIDIEMKLSVEQTRALTAALARWKQATSEFKDLQ